MTFMPPPPVESPPPAPRASRFPLAMVVLALATVVAIGAIVAIAQRGGSDAAAAPTSVSPAADPVVAPDPVLGLETREQPWRVTLTWSAPGVVVEDAKYEVRRNGTFLGYVDPPGRRFVDRNVVPGRNYNFEVRVEAPAGVFSDAAVVGARTPLPPIAEARLEGTFDIRTEFASKSGYGDYGAPGFGWRFEPKCQAGPCNTSLEDILQDDVRVSLTRAGRTYRGTFTGNWGLECGRTSIVSTVTIELRVMKARVIASEWRATRLGGTLTEREAAQLGCRSSSATLTVSAKLYA